MISVANAWQSELRKPVDGSQPLAAGFGTLITADVAPHTKGAWTDIVLAADWATQGFVGDAFEIEINFNAGSISAANLKFLCDIGTDSGGGYSAIINNLIATECAAYSALGMGVGYKFRLRIPTGVKVGCRIQSNTASATLSANVILRGNPTNPGLVRCGTFVRTLGAITASTDGTTVVAGTVAEGAWTAIATTADDLWAWEVGYGNSDLTVNNGTMLIDLASGAPASEVAFAKGWFFGKGTTEAVTKQPYDPVSAKASGTIVSARIQIVGAETNDSVVVYGVGGSYELPDAATATGTVLITGVAAPNGKTVKIYAVDTSGVVELVGSTTTGGGTGTFSLGCPDITREYFAKYEDGINVGCSLEGTPGVDLLDIAIGGSGGGGETVDPVITTVSSPTASGDPLVISVYDAASALALYILTCKDRSDGRRLTIYNPIDGAGNAGFVHPFGGRSTVTGSGTLADPYIFTIYRRGRWPTGLALDIRAQVVDAVGNEANA